MKVKNLRATAGWMMGAFVLMSLILGGIMGYDIASGTGLMRNNPTVAFVVVGFVLIAAMAVSVFWWLTIDEAQREAHKWAWYWGGSSGLLISVFAFVAALAGGDALMMPYVRFMDYEGHLVALGMITSLAPAIIGYGIAWLIWWLRHR